MRTISFVSSAVLSLASFFAFTSEALADDGAAPSEAAPVAAAAAPASESAPASPDKVKSDSAEDDIKHFSIELNPLAATIGRYSLTGEYVFSKHHAVTLTPVFTHAPVTITVNGKDVDGGSLNGFGGEAGYRFYTGSAGANGFYIGPSFLFSSFSQSGGGGSSDSFTSIGGALDLGGQAIVGPGIVLGGGFGLQYTATSKDINTDNLNLASAVIAGGGIRPRFLFTAGYSF